MNTARPLYLLTTLIVACSGEGTAPRTVVGNPEVPTLPNSDPAPGPTEQNVPSTPPQATDAPSLSAVEELALGPLFADSAELEGLTLGSDGALYVLDATTGLHRIESGSAVRVYSFADSAAADSAAGLTFTDVAAMGDQFLVTAENDGFLLDLTQQSLVQYFCYLPPAEPVDSLVRPSKSQELQAQGISATQRTESVAFNPFTGQLFVQPQTFIVTGDTLAASELFAFGQWGGEPIATQELANASFLAGGMVATHEENLTVGVLDYLVLGFGSSLYRMFDGIEPELFVQLPDVGEITGLTRDANGDLLLLDGGSKRVLRVGGVANVDTTFEGLLLP